MTMKWQSVLWKPGARTLSLPQTSLFVSLRAARVPISPPETLLFQSKFRMPRLQFAPFLCLVVLFVCTLQRAWADAVVPVNGAAKAAEIKRSRSPVSPDATDSAVVNADTIMADNNIRISDSQIVLAAQDKKAVIKAIADAVLAKQVGLSTTSDTDNSDSDGDKSKTGTMKKNAARVIPMPVMLPVSRDAFLYYVPDPKHTSKSIVRLGWRYSLSDWKLYRALIAPSACEVKRTIGDYYYC